MTEQEQPRGGRGTVQRLAAELVPPLHDQDIDAAALRPGPR